MLLKFTGRRTQLKEIDQLINTKQGAVFAVSGSAGIGKSTFLKEVARRYPKTGQVFIDINDVPPLQTATEFLQFFAKQTKHLKHTKKALAEINGTYKTTADLIAPYQELFKETVKLGLAEHEKELDLTDSDKSKFTLITQTLLQLGGIWSKNRQEKKKAELENPELYLLKAIRLDCKQHPLIFIDTYERLQAAQELSQQQIKSLYGNLNERLSPVSKALSLQDWLERLLDFLTANGAIVLIAGRRISRRDWKPQDLARFTDEEILNVVGNSKYTDLQALLVDEQTEQALLSLLKRLSFDGIPLWLQLALNFVSVELATHTITELAALDNLEALFAEPLDSSELISANIDHASCKLALFERVMQHYSAELKAEAWKMALPRRLDKAVLTVLFADQADTIREAFVRAGLLPFVRWEEGKQVSLHQEIRDLLLAYAKYKEYLKSDETQHIHQQLVDLFKINYQKSSSLDVLLEKLYHEFLIGKQDFSSETETQFLLLEKAGIILKEEDNDIEAEKAFKQQTFIKPENETGWHNLGCVLSYQEKFDEAINAFYKVLSINANHSCARSHLGDTLYMANRIDEAILMYEEQTKINPINDVWIILADIFYGQEKIEKSISAYRKHLEINPNSEDALHCLGEIFYERENFDSAFEIFTKLSEINPEHECVYYHLGDILTEKGNLKDATSAYKKQTEITPNASVDWKNLAYILKLQNEFEQAQQAYTRALEINSQDIDTLKWDAELALIQQDKNRCLQRIQQASVLVDNKDYHCVILPFLAWLAEPENSYQPVLTAIAQLDSSVKITWDFNDTEPAILRLTLIQQTTARKFIAYFQGTGALPSAPN